MNPVNATALYISASRLVLNYDPEDPQSFTEINKLLPYFRQSLSCCVCGNLLEDPIAPTNSTCQHYVCKTCKGKKMMMKPSCSWCKDYDQFEENKQLSILVSCYKKLYEYITQTSLARDILDAVDSSADLLASLTDRSLFAEDSGKISNTTRGLCLPYSPLPSTSEHTTESEVSLSQISENTHNIDIGCSVVNGLPSCNGLLIEKLAVNIPSPESSNPIDVCSSGDDIKAEDVSSHLESVCNPDSAADLCTTSLDFCGFSEIKAGDSLLLSVEEVLRSLESVSNTEVCDSDLKPSLETNLSNGPFAELCPQPLSHSVFMTNMHAFPHGISYMAATPKVVKLNRKRSRSESDSEKVQPLPISTIIHGPTLGASAPITVKQENKISLQPIATVPNGGTTPKISKTVILSSKSVKKNPEHVVKKSHPKAKPSIMKTKDKIKEKMPNSNVMPGSPAKIVYKKTQEKKGCKCGRATQNPSVLTCRGQRCPCYSNRKACLDCICRGCQNSYMANGEKKLEAFAVPEKALEQTRLTLGINVTSIAVRNASTSASVINVTGSPVATFLAASAHDDKNLDEAIDLRYDC
ncbi:E3 ubiquitin-protein ligase MSL2 isoform X1 [Microcaecilia unicolor]|uniref:E3 ubiquitin-protein ligase MSL2 n=2 Tax=Microcaecilia unicolor TaxID=1415580 RepID=A0A6P7Z951_9AMPH|nr:E3 ubiquitin-protein ligase MSL2 isoform X1 [Microcaecilia unicolor]